MPFDSGLSLYKLQKESETLSLAAYQGPWSLAGVHLHRSWDIGHLTGDLWP